MSRPHEKIQRPSADLVRSYLEKWNTLENYALQESSLRKLFAETYPRNDEMDDVLVKVCALNDFYSTNILSPFKIARRIVELQIDERLSKQDLSLVNEMACVEVSGGKTRNFYSFATKYCSHHLPESYPIYDSYVEKMLKHFRRHDKFCAFRNDDLRRYPRCHEVHMRFRERYSLERFNAKEIDRHLWQAGRECFGKRR